jgi:hypothetical protein
MLLNVVDTLMSLLHNGSHRSTVTLKLLWDQLRSAYVEMNTSNCKNFDKVLNDLTCVSCTRAMLVQPRNPLTDLNRRRGMGSDVQLCDDDNSGT